MVKLLAQHKATIDIRDATSGNTPLHTAAKWGQTECGQYLLDNHADINAQNLIGETPLARAVLANNPATVKMLLDNNANIEIRNADGKTAMQLSIEFDRAMITASIKRKMSTDLLK